MRRSKLKITYKTKKLERVCTDFGKAKHEYGIAIASKLIQRIGEISAADSVEMLVQYSIGRCHPLKGNRDGQYAMDLAQPYRLVFEKNGTTIQLIRVISIEDYH